MDDAKQIEGGIEVIDRALALLGSNGEHWVKGMFRATANGLPALDSRTTARMCLSGALTVAGADAESLVRMALRRALPDDFQRFVGPSIVAFNDDAATTFDDIKRLCETAKEILKERRL